VVPGEYTIELAAGGVRQRQTVVVEADPRVKASPADLAAQFELAMRIGDELSASFDGYHALAAMRSAVAERAKAVGGTRDAKQAAADLEAFDRKVDAIQNGTTSAPGVGVANRELARLFSMVESGDARPSAPLRTAAAEWCDALAKAIESWRRLNSSDVPALNAALERRKLPTIAAAPVPTAPSCGTP